MRKDRHNIVIIEPSEVVARGLSALLSEAEQLQVIDTFADVAKFRQRTHLIDTCSIIIINPLLLCYGKQGVASLRTLFPHGSLVALLHSYIDSRTLSQFDQTIGIYDPPTKIIDKLERITSTQGSAKSGSESGGELSDREKEILIAVSKGMINKEIADLHNISVHTVIAHRKNISRKTGIKSVSGFVVYALLNNYIDEHEILY